MKVLVLVDKIQSAIHRLALSIEKDNPHLDIAIIPLHPKRPDMDQIEAMHKAFLECDILHVMYWKSGEKMKEYVDITTKPSILSHHNPYNVLDEDWTKTYNHVTCNNESIHEDISYSELIPMGINLDFYKFNEEYADNKVVNMVVGRIEGKKGVLEVAQACKELEYKFVLVGKISKPEYFAQVKAANPDMDFRENITDEELREAYYESTIHVCNSIDGFESGTLPILEAMACGVPVLTRNIGHIPELYSGTNMVVRKGKQEDLKDLKKELKSLMDNIGQRESMREKAWDTVKNRNDKRMSRRFESAYYRVVKKDDDQPWVSVIVPTCDRPNTLIECLAMIENQTYPLIEVIVPDSGEESSEDIVEAFRAQTNKPVKYIRFDKHGEYSLAKARNLAVIDAVYGGLLVFCDERIGMARNAVENFAKAWTPKAWLWGIKDDAKKGFVENFSCVERRALISGGMFNERMSQYGGMTQELRTRFSNKLDFELIFDAQAKTISRSRSKASKRKAIIDSKFRLFKMYG